MAEPAHASNGIKECDRIKMVSKEKSKLKQCTVVLTHGCNLRCDFCYAKGADYRADDQLSYDELKRIVDLCGAADMRYIFFTGGEPLTHPRIIDILRYINDRYPSITPTIATNGVLLEDPELCRRLVDSGLKYLDISMKGADGADWEKATGYDGFARQLRAISNLASQPVEFTCSMVLTMDSVTKVCDAVRAAYDHGASQFSFTFFIDNTESRRKGWEYLEEHNPFALIESFVSQIDRLSAITDDWWVEYSFPICVYTERQLELLDGRLAGPCQIHLMNAITVNTKMELLPCDLYINTKLGRMGEDFSSYPELMSWMETPKFRAVMNGMRKWPSEKCSSCEHLEECYGGCPVLWKNYSFDALMDFKADRSKSSNR